MASQGPQADIGLIGLAVMGQNLVLNMNDHGFHVAVYNRSPDKTRAFIEGVAKGTQVQGFEELSSLIQHLKQPRKIMLMVKAGEVVDSYLDTLVPMLEPGDIVIDGGNSNFPDTSRRVERLAQAGLHYIGAGVSGGEEGARWGPSIMPGGDQAAWPQIKPIFQAVSAKTEQGEACCEWVGQGGAGHFVKMVHNGIEYGDMQLIAEAYHFMQSALGMDGEAMQQTFEQWNQTELNSYLVEITAAIMGYKEGDGLLLDQILDAAGQKGTGKWTGIHALDHGVPLTLITESVFARCLSALKEERMKAEIAFGKREISALSDRASWLEALRQALLAAKIISYAQGFMLMREASEEFGWQIDYGKVALMWREGCIIRSAFLGNIRDAYEKSPELAFLGLDPFFKSILKDCDQNWRKVCAKAIELGVPMPSMTSALSFLDGYTHGRLPANLIQAQRDYFGAHTYERLDRPRGEFHHTDWTGQGGDVSSGTYQV